MCGEKKLPNRLLELRKKSGLRQQDIADHLSVSKGSYSLWETGKIEISNDNLFRLADFFDVTIDYLLGKSNHSTPLPPDIAAILEENVRLKAKLANVRAALDQDELID